MFSFGPFHCDNVPEAIFILDILNFLSIMAAAPSDFAPNGEISWIILFGLADIDDSLAEASASLSPSAGENKKATVK